MSVSIFEYIERHRDGSIQDDVTYRGYDLMHRASNARVNRALQRSGYAGDVHGLAMLHGHLASRGHAMDFEYLKERLNEWYMWCRLSTGQIRQWKERSVQNG